MSQSTYKTLPGRSVTWSGPSRVWLAADHILLVLSRTYVESYRRFFFNDIQAFVIRRTDMSKIWNVVWGAFFLFFGALALTIGERTAAFILAGLAVPFAVALFLNLLRGPTCIFYIRTAVQTERLPALSRVRAAEKFITQVEPLIRASQGEWPQELANEFATLQFGQFAPTTEAQPTVGS